jgi:hypothetical protein
MGWMVLLRATIVLIQHCGCGELGVTSVMRRGKNVPDAGRVKRHFFYFFLLAGLPH